MYVCIYTTYLSNRFAIRRTYRTNYATFPINTLNLQVKVPFSQILPSGLSILRGLFT